MRRRSKSESIVNNTRDIPKSIVALGSKFQVQLATLSEDTSGDMEGLIRRIRINEDLNSSRRWSTLLHEYLHACLYINGVASVIDEDLEEVIVQSLEHGIIEFLSQVGESGIQAIIEQSQADSKQIAEDAQYTKE